MSDYCMDCPICDSDIWVDLCLGDIEENLFKKYKKVYFVSVVRDEIIKWKSGKYSFIAKKLEKKINENKAEIIEIEKIDSLDREIIEKQLIEDCGYELGFSTPKDKRKNMGEYVSAIVADYYGIELMKSNDHLFNEGQRGKELYPDLEIKNWRQTVVDLVEDIGERKQVFDKVKKANNDMNKEKDNYENGQATLEDILRLQKHFS